MADVMPTTDPLDEQDETEGNIIPLNIIARGMWLLAKIVIPLFIGAIVIAWVFTESITLGLIFAGVGFVLMLFISIPLWLATVEDEMIDHHSEEEGNH